MRTALAALLLALLALAAAARAAAPTAAAASAATASFAASARGVRRGGKLRVTNYKLEGDVTASTLELTRFEVFAPDATVRALLLHGQGGRHKGRGAGRHTPVGQLWRCNGCRCVPCCWRLSRGLHHLLSSEHLQIVVQSSGNRAPRRIARPSTAFFKGSIAGAPGSSVLLAVQPNGAVHGMAHRRNASFVLARQPRPTAAAAGPAAAAAALATAPLSSRKTTSTQTQALPKFNCGVQHKAAPPRQPRAAGASSGSSRKLQQVCSG